VEFSQEQVEELKLFCPDARPHVEGGTTYFFLPGLRLPDGCSPAQMNALLCPTGHHGYTSRLLFEGQFSSRQARNWHFNAHILGRNWAAISWNIPATGLRLAQILAEHLRAFR